MVLDLVACALVVGSAGVVLIQITKLLVIDA
jgi:hypothetical protein